MPRLDSYDCGDNCTKMATVGTMSRYGFCYLSGIPHLWLRLQTVRCTELLVDLNTIHAPIGDTTRARLRRILRPAASTVGEAIDYSLRTKIRKRMHNRTVNSICDLIAMGGSLKYNSEDEKEFMPKILAEDLHRALYSS